MNKDTIAKAQVLELLSIIQRNFDTRANLKVVKVINEKSLEIIKEI